MMAPRVRRRLAGEWGRRSVKAIVPLCVALLAFAPSGANAETIEQALARAYQNNPQLNAQRAIVRQTDESVAQALSGYRPTLSANASAGDQYTTEKEIFPRLPGTPLTKGHSLQV